MNAAQTASIPGVFMNVFGLGTLLIGKSGSGKSDLALALIDRGHQLIADDVVEFNSHDAKILTGQSPHLLKNLLEIRGLGILDIPALFGRRAVLEKQRLSLVIKLEHTTQPTHDLYLQHPPYLLLNIPTPCYLLPLSDQRPREVLLETMVRNHRLLQQGNNAHMKFIHTQTQALRVSA